MTPAPRSSTQTAPLTGKSDKSALLTLNLGNHIDDSKACLPQHKQASANAKASLFMLPFVSVPASGSSDQHP
jgi:hypothetical protein